MISKLPVNRVVGAKQTLRAIKSGNADTVYLAENADVKVAMPIVDACRECSVELVYIPTMKSLGELCGIDVNAATACVIKNQL